MMEKQYKKFHFQEVDWLIYFPLYGNCGKYRGYTIFLVERKDGKLQTEQTLKLGDVLDRPEIDQHYPHTVGYYRSAAGDGADFKPEYLELRGIGTVEEFWMFLNSLNL
jgi:hypothetical protein